MKIILPLVFLSTAVMASDVVTNDYNGVKCVVNYDPSRIEPYTLEDPLQFIDGRKVTTPDEWRERRKEILELFAKEMYGVEPPKPEALVTDLVKERVTCAGCAIRRQYAMYFRSDRTGPCVNWYLWLPTSARGRKVPVILLLNYRGASELVSDEDIPLTTGWVREGKHTENHRVTEKTRGMLLDQNSDGSIFPLQMILARGYAVLTACYAEVSPDPNPGEAEERYNQRNFAYTGVFELWGRRDETRTDNITALGAWAWALSRGLDLAERIPEVDAKKSVVTGCSRLGKSALIAAARDERFAVLVANQCGGGGVCLAKRNYGENVKTEVNAFSHWYCRAYDKYAENPAKLLTFDQHLFLATIAPRPVLIEGMTDSKWMDTEAEYLACRAASPVWRFFGFKGMPDVPYPENWSEAAIGDRLGYVRRPLAHGIFGIDWQWMMDFADRNLPCGGSVAREERPFPEIGPVKRLTSGPKDHLFANYFAINAWSPGDYRYVAVLETDINGRLPEANERITLGLVDTQDGNRFIPVTTTACWNFQEATMFHWLAQEPDTFVFNDMREGKAVAVVMNWKTKKERILPRPVSAVSRDGTKAISINYSRLYLTRPDYGYPGNGQDDLRGVEWPENDGLWLMDMKTGESKLILSVAQGRSEMLPTEKVEGKPGHPLAYYCHTVLNPDATRVFFLARSVNWFDAETHKIPSWNTTSFTVKTDGTDLRKCFPQGDWGGSHFHWKNNEEMVVTVWPKEVPGRSWHVVFKVGEEEKGHRIAKGLLDWDGHCNYSPDGEWMSTEGYYDQTFLRNWVLMRTADEACKPIGSFFVPEAYRGGYWRCDLHSRWRPDGRQLGFNSVHEGSRQVYVIDVDFKDEARR